AAVRRTREGRQGRGGGDGVALGNDPEWPSTSARVYIALRVFQFREDVAAVRGSVHFLVYIFFFKQKTAYEIETDWSSDVCSSDLTATSRTQIGGKRVTQSNESGEFHLIGLTPGTFRVRFEATGLKEVVKEDIHVGVNETSSLD